MEPVVGQFLGYTIGIGMLVSVLTQLIKTAKTIPYLNKIPGVQKIVDAVSESKPEEVRIFVAVIAVLMNAASMYINESQIISVPMIVSSFGSFLTALGTYDLVLKGEKKKDEPETPQA